MSVLADRVDGVIGVDTHRDTLTAAAVTVVGGLLGQVVVAADAAGYQCLLGFARDHVPGRRCFAVEGAGSYGAGLTRLLVERGEWVVEVDRPGRPARRGGQLFKLLQRYDHPHVEVVHVAETPTAGSPACSRLACTPGERSGS